MVSMNTYFLTQLNNLNSVSEKLSYQSASGEELKNGSDDSVTFAKILNAEYNIKIYSNLQSNLTDVEIFNTSSDSSLKEIKTAMQTVQTEILKSLNAGMSEDDYISVATNLEGIKETLLMLANEKTNGQYLFAGNNTTIKPFVEDTTTGKITYAGEENLKKIAIEKNTYSEQGVTGIDIFYYDKDNDGIKEQSYFDDLDEIINALKGLDSSGNTISGDNITSILRTKLDDIASGYDSANVAHSILGGRNKIFGNAQDYISTKLLNYKTIESTYASADLTEVSLNMKSLELTYTSLYSVISKLNDLSLINFIK